MCACLICICLIYFLCLCNYWPLFILLCQATNGKRWRILPTFLLLSSQKLFFWLVFEIFNRINFTFQLNILNVSLFSRSLPTRLRHETSCVVSSSLLCHQILYEFYEYFSKILFSYQPNIKELIAQTINIGMTPHWRRIPIDFSTLNQI